MSAVRLIKLQQGDIFTVVGLPSLGAFVLIRKHESGCTVRTTRIKRVEFEANGNGVAFDAPASGRRIFAAGTLVDVIEEDS